jgi:hypothetical protein
VPTYPARLHQFFQTQSSKQSRKGLTFFSPSDHSRRHTLPRHFWATPTHPACKRTCNESHDTRRRCGVKRGRDNLGTDCLLSLKPARGQVGLKGEPQPTEPHSPPTHLPPSLAHVRKTSIEKNLSRKVTIHHHPDRDTTATTARKRYAQSAAAYWQALVALRADIRIYCWLLVLWDSKLKDSNKRRERDRDPEDAKRRRRPAGG